jgi:hypothetical protein
MNGHRSMQAFRPLPLQAFRPLPLAVVAAAVGSLSCADGQTDVALSEASATGAARTLHVRETLASRAQDAAVREAIMGALLYLDDTQIRERPGLWSPLYDACSGDGCLPTLPGAATALPLPLPFSRNVAGEWANIIHIGPRLLGALSPEQRSLIQIQDSNMFMVAAISYPLYLIDESSLDPGQRIAETLRASAHQTIAGYKRGTAYAFWPQLPGSSSPAPRVGPLNVPMIFANGTRLIELIPEEASGPASTAREWMEAALDEERNPYGVDAFANIPNDADDSATAVVSQWLHHRYDQGPPPGAETLQELLAWRDLGRTLQDGRDGWKGLNSGAFLTWLKDENDALFATPQTGVIPLGVNNVDCVVNANVLLAMALNGQHGEHAVRSTVTVLHRAVQERAWEACGLYYPQRMMFPYALSRAHRDGRFADAQMVDAMRILVQDLLSEQQAVAAQHGYLAGAFSGGADPSYDLATALGLSALLNIGADIADEAGVGEAYGEGVEAAVAFLVRRQQRSPIRFHDTFNREGNPRLRCFDSGRRWTPGVYFAASSWDLAQWKSEAFAVAMVLEALLKYTLAYDLGGVDIQQGRRVRVLRYAFSADKAPQDFRLIAEYR